MVKILMFATQNLVMHHNVWHLKEAVPLNQLIMMIEM